MWRKASFVALIILTMIVAPLSAFHLVVGIWALIVELHAPGIIPIVPEISLAFVIGALIFLALLAGLWRWYFATNKNRTDHKPSSPNLAGQYRMFEFFKGWRRKVGCVLLVMATVFVSGWVRSKSLCDIITVNADHDRYNVMSYDGILTFFTKSNGISTGFDLWATWDAEVFEYPQDGLAIPYWSFAVPLTLLAAYLLLSPVRRTKPPTPPSPNYPISTKP